MTVQPTQREKHSGVKTRLAAASLSACRLTEDATDLVCGFLSAT